MQLQQVTSQQRRRLFLGVKTTAYQLYTLLLTLLQLLRLLRLLELLRRLLALVLVLHFLLPLLLLLPLLVLFLSVDFPLQPPAFLFLIVQYSLKL